MMKGTERVAGIRTGWWWKELRDTCWYQNCLTWNALSQLLELELA